MSEPESKLIASDSESSSITHYVVTVSDGRAVNTRSDYIPKGDSFIISDLRTGTWTIGAEGYVDTTGSGSYVRIASASDEIELTEGENTLTLKLALDEGKSGKISITLQLPDEIGSGDSFGYWYAVTDMEGSAGAVAASAGSEEEPVSAEAGDGVYQLDIDGIEQGRYLFMVSVKDSEGNVYTAADGMRLMKDMTASGTLEPINSGVAGSIDASMTVEDFIGDLIEFRDLDGTTHNWDGGTLSFELPASYSYRWYLDGIEYSNIAEAVGSSEEKKSYTVNGLEDEDNGRHMLTVVAYFDGKNIEVGTANMAIDKLDVAVEKQLFSFSLNDDEESYAVTGLVEPIGKFEMPENGVLEIPATYKGKPVTDIAKHCFKDRTDITGKVIIPEGVTEISDQAFMGCISLNEVVLPSTLEKLGTTVKAHTTGVHWYGVFEDCASLRNIKLPEGLITIGVEAFKNCELLENVIIPNSVKEIGDLAFSGCKSFTKIIIPEGITQIKMGTFSYCSNLSEISLPSTLKEIKGGVYSEDAAFGYCKNLRSIIIPDGVTEIGNNAFVDCESLEYVFLPDSVTTIRKYAICFTQSLKNIYVPNDITVIEYGGLAGVNEDVYFAVNLRQESWDEDALNDNADYFWGVSRSDYDSIIAGTFDVAEPVIAFTTDGNTCSITSDTTFVHIYYTTDGSDPTAENGTLYAAPFAVEEGNTVKAVAYVGMETYSDIVTERFSAIGGSTS